MFFKIGKVDIDDTAPNQYFSVSLHNTKWPPMISRIETSVENLDLCTSICTLVVSYCHLAVFKEADKLCYLGELVTSTSVVATSSTGEETVYISESITNTNLYKSLSILMFLLF